MSEVFDSIQGEGQDTGRLVTFVRLAGCNLRCAWCDTAYALDGGDEMEVGEIASRCGYRVCITGGEPLLQDIGVLIRVFENQRHIAVETNGSILPPEWARDRATGAPRAGNGILWSVAPKFGSSGETPDVPVLAEWCRQERVQVKFVFSGEADWREARGLASCVPGLSRHPVYLQPNGQDWQGLTRWAWNRMGDWCGFDARLAPQMHVTVWGQERCR